MLGQITHTVRIYTHRQTPTKITSFFDKQLLQTRKHKNRIYSSAQQTFRLPRQTPPRIAEECYTCRSILIRQFLYCSCIHTDSPRVVELFLTAARFVCVCRATKLYRSVRHVYLRLAINRLWTTLYTELISLEYSPLHAIMT